MTIEDLPASGTKKPSPKTERLLYWVGEAIRLALELTHTSKKEFSERTGVSKSSLSRLMNLEGGLDLSTLVRICDGLNIPPSVLMMLAEIKEKRHLKQPITPFEEEIERVLMNAFWDGANNKWNIPKIGVYLKGPDWVDAN